MSTVKIYLLIERVGCGWEWIVSGPCVRTFLAIYTIHFLCCCLYLQCLRKRPSYQIPPWNLFNANPLNQSDESYHPDPPDNEIKKQLFRHDLRKWTKAEVFRGCVSDQDWIPFPFTHFRSGLSTGLFAFTGLFAPSVSLILKWFAWAATPRTFAPTYKDSLLYLGEH